MTSEASVPKLCDAIYLQSNKIARCATSSPGSSQTSVEENLPQAVNEAKLAARKLPGTWLGCGYATKMSEYLANVLDNIFLCGLQVVM